MEVTIKIDRGNIEKILDSIDVKDIELYLRKKKLTNIVDPKPIEVKIKNDDYIYHNLRSVAMTYNKII